MDYEMDQELDLMQQAELEAEAENNSVEHVEDQGQEIEADNDDAGGTERVVVQPKRIVRNPHPKLNAERLRGPRGLTALSPLFAKQTFQGKGHEEADLNVLLKTYEYWCHRLFPKLQFEQCIDRIESIGSKRAVVTYVKKIRAGIVDDDEVEQEEVRREEEPEQVQMIEERNETDDNRFDSLMGSNHRQQDAQDALTEEQMERIRLNKERAMELRRQRLKAIREKAAAQMMPSTDIPVAATSNLQSQDLFSNAEVNVTTQNDDIESMLEQEEELRAEFVDEQSVISVDEYLSSLANCK